MEVIKAKSAGFCFGVKKAMETVYQQIEENANKLHNTPCYNEQVKDRMNVSPLLAKPIQDSSHRIRNTARKTPEQAAKRNCFHRGLCRKQNTPAHSDIADHRKLGVFFEVDRRQRCRHCRKSPHDAKQDPTPCRRGGTNAAKQNGRIGAPDEKIDGAMVDDLHHLFAGSLMQSVIDAGNGIHCNE